MIIDFEEKRKLGKMHRFYLEKHFVNALHVKTKQLINTYKLSNWVASYF